MIRRPGVTLSRGATVPAIDRELLRAQLPHTLVETDLPGLGELYRGKVRDNYVRDDTILMVTTDRISAFDRVLGTLPFKGQALTAMAEWWFDETVDIVRNHIRHRPHPCAWEARRCAPIAVEMVVRGYLTGVTPTSVWTAYQRGDREFCGNELPDGMRQNEPFDEPILTPSTKAEQGGHDESVAPRELFRLGLIDRGLYDELARISMKLYHRGVERAAEKGLIFVDTKYEFGIADGNITLMDEVNTPDSSRYWEAADYQKRFAAGQKPKALDKEYVRTWLAGQGFTGEGEPPALTDKLRVEASFRYLSLLERFTGEPLAVHPEPVLPSLRAALDPYRR